MKPASSTAGKTSTARARLTNSRDPGSCWYRLASALSTDESMACRRVAGSPERELVVVQPLTNTIRAASKAMKVLLFMIKVRV